MTVINSIAEDYCFYEPTVIPRRSHLQASIKVPASSYESLANAEHASMKNIAIKGLSRSGQLIIIGNPHFTVTHSLATRVFQSHMINLFAWYGNEYMPIAATLKVWERFI